jgi:hypothetical protein
MMAISALLVKGKVTQAEYNAEVKKLTDEEMIAGVQKLDQEWVLLFGNMENALANFLNTGEFGFRKMVDSMLRDISRLLAKQIILGGLGFAMGGNSGNAIAMGAAALGGAATGFDGIVPGAHPGVDKTTFAARVTPGERVTITTPKQQARQARGGGRGGMTFVNAYDPRQVADMLNTPAGRRAMADATRINPGIVTRRTK